MHRQSDTVTVLFNHSAHKMHLENQIQILLCYAFAKGGVFV